MEITIKNCYSNTLVIIECSDNLNSGISLYIYRLKFGTKMQRFSSLIKILRYVFVIRWWWNCRTEQIIESRKIAAHLKYNIEFITINVRLEQSTSSFDCVKFVDTQCGWNSWTRCRWKRKIYAVINLCDECAF